MRRRRPTLKLICDTDSVWSRFVLRELPYASGLRRARIQWSGRRKEAEERDFVAMCDVTTGVSEVDVAYYRSIADDPGRIFLFSNVIDLASYQSRPPAPAGLRRPSIYLAGSFGHYHSPMDVAARWVISEILPRVRREIPDVHFYILGTNSDRTLGHITDPGITVTGRVPSVLPYLCHTDVALVPLTFESGTRFKILEAGACRTPIVSTVLGAEGIDVEDGHSILLADDPDEFAQAVLRLLRDKELAARLATGCYELVSKRYSVASLRVEAHAILEYLRR